MANGLQIAAAVRSIHKHIAKEVQPLRIIAEDKRIADNHQARLRARDRHVEPLRVGEEAKGVIQSDSAFALVTAHRRYHDGRALLACSGTAVLYNNLQTKPDVLRQGFAHANCTRKIHHPPWNSSTEPTLIRSAPDVLAKSSRIFSTCLR